MGLIKDPDEDINQLEEIIYNDVFSDINTPGYWKAETEEDLKTPKIIVLDGHSTLLVYNKSDADLPWSAYNDLGQYKYTPDNVGDGIVIFSHSFYFEFEFFIGNKEILAESTFDGNGIKAITLPLKDVSIDEIFNVMSKRLGEAVTSEIQSFDDTIELKKGKKITIPDSISMKIGMKLSLMGIVLITLKAKEIVEIEARAKEEIVEKVYEERSTKMKDMLEVEEKESKKKRKSKPKKKVEKVPEEILTQPKASRSVAAGAGPPSPTSIPSPPPTTGAPAGPPPTSASPPPPPSVVASESAPPPSPVPSAPTAAPKPVVKPQPSVMPPPLKAEVEELEPEPAEMAEDMDVMAFDDADEVDDMLIAKG
ncbi:MAG: hypothetical protein ACW99Q_15220, partial [Candidatus Kariarchaeaceae archaeon]